MKAPLVSVLLTAYNREPFLAPAIESVLIDTHGVEAMGAGETAITIVAAAVGNAVFDATGVRLREVPFTADRVKRALAASSSG